MSYLKRVVAARNAYLALLSERREGFRTQVDVCRSEFTVRLHGETPLLGNLYVFDTAGVDDTRFCAQGADADEIEVGETVETDAGVRIGFQGLCWNRTLFRTVGAPLPLDQISPWFEKWIGDASDQGEVPHTFLGVHDWFAPHVAAAGSGGGLARLARAIVGRGGKRGIAVPGPVNDEGFRGVIHGCALRNDHDLTVDFGSAAIGAFDELVTILERCGAEEIVIKPEREGRDLYDQVLEMLQDRHDVEIGADTATSADAFFDWFVEEADRIAAQMDEMRSLQIGRNPKDFDKGLAIHEKIMSQALPEIEAVHENLVIDFMNGVERPNRLIVSAGGNPVLAQIVRDVVARAPKIPGWDIEAFRPPAPLSFAIDLDVPGRGAVSIDAEKFRASLAPRLDRIDVDIHIADADAELRHILKETAVAVVERVVGEIAFMECVGDISVTPGPADLAETIPVNDLPNEFDRAIAEARRRAGTIQAEPEAGRVAANLSLLEGDLAAFETVFSDFGKIHDVRIRLDLWSPTEDTLEKVDDSFEDFRATCERTTSILGTGFGVVAIGVPPVEATDIRAWLSKALAPAVADGAILVCVSEAELYIEGMVEELDHKASELLDGGDWASAAQLMRPLLARFGDIEDGRMHAKTGLCYLMGGHHELALRFFEQALERVTDDEWRGETLTNTAICLQHLGRVPDALPHYQGALELDPKSALRHYNLGQAYALIGDPQKACTHLREAAVLDPQHAKKVMEDPDLNPIRDTEPFVALARDLAA